MPDSMLRIGIVGCGHAAGIHLERYLPLEGVRIVGCADPVAESAEALAAQANASGTGPSAVALTDHRDLIKQLAPDVLAIFTPHLAHYRVAMDALQADCHVFVEHPLSTNVQEAADIVSLATGRNRKVGVGHQYRMLESLLEARRRIHQGLIGPLRLVTATFTQDWLSTHRNAENTWRFDPKVSGGGVLADAGVHLIDALLWSTGKVAVEAAAVQCELDTGLDVVTAATVRLADGVPMTLGISGVTPSRLFEINYFGERGRLQVTEQALWEGQGSGPPQMVPLAKATSNIDENFVQAVREGTPLCCPAAEALDTVRLQEAIGRSAKTGQAVRLT